MNKETTIPTPALVLGLSGLIPFVVAATALWILEDYQRYPVELGLLGYGAVILSFLGGVKWGEALTSGAAIGWQALLLAVSPSLVGWLALLLSPAAGISLLLAGFLTQYLIDRHWVRSGSLPAWYARLRLLLTAIVAASLLGSLIRILLN